MRFGRRHPLAVLAIALAGACSGGGDASDDVVLEDIESDEPGAADSAASDTTAATIDPTADTPASALGGVFFAAMKGTNLGEPGQACFDDAAAGLTPDASAGLADIHADPFAYSTLEPPARLELARAYFGCIDEDTLIMSLASGIAGALDTADCVIDAWRGHLTADVIATSVATGNGLDDLPAPLVDQLAASGVACQPEQQWWIDELALRLEHSPDVPDSATGCVAAAYIETFGAERFLASRLLTLGAMEVIGPADGAQLDLANRCGISFEFIDGTVGAVRGQCLSGFGESATTEIADCAGGHNAEVIDTHDLSAVFNTWPGYTGMHDNAVSQCGEDFDALSGDLQGWGYGWDFVDRAAWERGERILTCVLLSSDGTDWVGASGLIS